MKGLKAKDLSDDVKVVELKMFRIESADSERYMYAADAVEVVSRLKQGGTDMSTIDRVTEVRY